LEGERGEFGKGKEGKDGLPLAIFVI